MPRLTLSRRDGERIVVSAPGHNDIVIEVVKTRKNRAKVRITAPESVEIIRSELLDTTRAR